MHGPQRTRRLVLEQIPRTAGITMMMDVLVEIEQRDHDAIFVGEPGIPWMAVMFHRAAKRDRDHRVVNRQQHQRQRNAAAPERDPAAERRDRQTCAQGDTRRRYVAVTAAKAVEQIDQMLHALERANPRPPRVSLRRLGGKRRILLRIEPAMMREVGAAKEFGQSEGQQYALIRREYAQIRPVLRERDAVDVLVKQDADAMLDDRARDERHP